MQGCFRLGGQGTHAHTLRMQLLTCASSVSVFMCALCCAVLARRTGEAWSDKEWSQVWLDLKHIQVCCTALCCNVYVQVLKRLASMLRCWYRMFWLRSSFKAGREV